MSLQILAGSLLLAEKVFADDFNGLEKLNTMIDEIESSMIF